MKKLVYSIMILAVGVLLSGAKSLAWSPHLFKYAAPAPKHHYFTLPPNPVMLSRMITDQFYDLPSFVAIAIPDDIDVKVEGSMLQSVKATGATADLSCFAPQVSKGVLYLRRIHTYTRDHYCGHPQGRIQVEIQAHSLYSVIKLGDGDFVADNIDSPYFDLTAAGEGNIRLTGIFHLTTLNYSGPGNVAIYWVDSPVLSIMANGTGELELAGIVGVLHTDLQDLTHLDARYLHAHNGFISTKNEAEADVWVHNDLYVLADNLSNIYYFAKPNFLYRDSRYGGSALEMYDIPGALEYFNTGKFAW